ncbi:DUF5797 family protein [Haloarcula sp. S1CR25-12]|uniref:DUF5797 family protein n=1 Tax=Haloarcula saliterrae TaxID=2950534 RepID=A0ABU2FCI1_9EURY|nr:DUF5797 family protein [Haloarcula sp. S1CR25-12]MDS0259969.1 DUF5797 family protein [Haloarcula sp. S1CR25-12]
MADTNGAAYVYTIEVLPFETRYLDPTLSGYLLDANDRCPISAPEIATKSRRNAYGDYVDRLSEYWGIPGDELRAQFSDIPGLATSTLGPLPVVEDLSNPDRVTERFRSIPDSYQRKRHDVRSVKKNIAFHKSRCRRTPSLGAFQSFALYLFDLNEYATIESDAQLRELIIQGGEIFYRCLYGDLWAGGPTPWEPFTIATTEDLDTRDRRVVDIVEHQPTSNGQLADRWGFEDGKAVWTYLQDELNGLTTRNSDQFICATESARKYVEGLANDGKIELSKEPPRVPGQGRINLEVSTQEKNDSDSGVDWSRL